MAKNKILVGAACVLAGLTVQSRAVAEVVAPYVVTNGPHWVAMDDVRTVAAGSALDFSAVARSARRTYGANLCFTATAPDRAASEALVANLVRCGYGSLRLHHFEWNFWNQGPQTDAQSRDRFDWLVAVAVSNRLTLAADCFASRRVRWEDLGITNRTGEIGHYEYKGLVQVNRRARVDWERHVAAFLSHRNPYTGRTYAQEPALRYLTMLNEGNLITSWNKVRAYADISLPRKDGGHPSVAWAEASRMAGEEMRAFVRKLGCRALLTDLNNGPNYAVYHPTKATYDYVDVHYYFDHPERVTPDAGMPPATFLDRDPVEQLTRAMTALPPARLFGRPFVLTEWNAAGPAPRRAGVQLGFAALAGLQDWDGAWRFAYSHRAEQFQDGRFPPMFFDTVTDPVNRALEAAVVCLYARGDVPPLKPAVAVADTPELFDAKRFGGLKDGELGWDARAALSARIYSVLPGQACPPGAASVERTANRGKPPFPAGLPPSDVLTLGTNGYAVTTRLTCGGYGADGAHVVAGPLTAVVGGTGAAVWASSLDGRPLETSDRILAGHVTDAQAEGTVWHDASMRRLERYGKPGRLLARRGTAEIVLMRTASAAREMTVYALDMGGTRRAVVPARVEKGELRFTASVAQPSGGTFFYEIRRH